jgi:hypothetical protein
MPYEKKGNNRSRRMASGFVMVVAKNCTLKPSSKDAWRVDLTPLFLVGLLGEATNTVEVKGLETLAFALLVGRAFLLDGFKANAAFADADNHTTTRSTLAVCVVLLGEGETDFGNASSARFLRVVEEILLLLNDIN